jgi:hypothetical protein
MKKMKPLLLIHIPKTAGQSIQANTDEPVYCRGHVLAKNITDLKQFKSFAVVRNPYERMVSSFFFYKYLYKGSRDIGRYFKRYRTFAEFITRFNACEYRDDMQFLPQYKFIFDDDGKLLVDHVLRFETLADDWSKLIGRESRLPMKNRSPYKEFDPYTEHTQEVVYQMFKKDFELLNYNK